jgi:hypothetical protein
MTYYGRLGSILRRKNIAVKFDPEHVDGVGGLKPVGDYYFYQATIVAIPAMFLAVWVLLIPMWPRDYGHWYEAYLMLLIVTIAIEILAFFVPLTTFHRVILEARQTLHRKADETSLKIQRIHQQITDDQTPPELRKELISKLDALQKRYWAIERMRTWPVHPQVRRRFGINNLLLLIPIANDLLNRAIDLKKIISAIAGWQT